MGHPAPGPDAPKPRPRQAPRQAVPVAGHTALTVKPGQTLVLATADASMTPDRAARLRDQLSDRLPGVEIVIAAGVTQMAAYDPGEPE